MKKLCRSVDFSPFLSGWGVVGFHFRQDTMYWKRQLWAAHNRVECEVMQGMHDQGLPVVKVRLLGME